MCGIAGFLSVRELEDVRATAIAKQMANTLAHRGPDDAGLWIDRVAGLALAHRRLSIQDLTAAGHQPMVSMSGRYVIAFNGEIYNHLEIRALLEGRGSLGMSWKGHCDTETLLAAIDRWGVEISLKHCVGMFAFALWDRDKRTLYLARDRMGEKPLYYGWQGNTFLFGSELQALKAHPAFLGSIDRQVIPLFFAYNYIPCPFSIFLGIYKLPPGCILTVTSSPNSLQRPRAYWSLNTVAEDGQRAVRKWSEAEAVSLLQSTLRSAVKRQMISDLPIGAFLSGGVDSSLIVAMMQRESHRPVRTFTIGFNEKEYDEAKCARAVAKHLGTDHTEMYVSAQEAMEVIPSLPLIYDEPFSDSSQIPTILVAQLAKSAVSVSLSGDGGDELFGGYSRYAAAARWHGRMAMIPAPLRRMIGYMVGLGCKSARLSKRKPSVLGISCNLGGKMQKLSRLMQANPIEGLYREFVAHWRPEDELLVDTGEYRSFLSDPALWPRLSTFETWMTCVDAQSYLPDDILTKVDRAAMSISLETRMPMLDHTVVELAFKLPMRFKVKSGDRKWILKEILADYVPGELTKRPKMGFALPLSDWMRGPMRAWVESQIDPQRIRREGFLNHNAIERCWLRHLAGTRDESALLWHVLMFESWLEKQ